MKHVKRLLAGVLAALLLSTTLAPQRDQQNRRPQLWQNQQW